MPTKRAEGRSYVRYSLDSVAANGTNSSEAIDLSDFQELSVQVIHAAHDDTSTFALQMSNDGGSNYETISGTSTTTSGAAGSDVIQVNDWGGSLLRFTITEADGAATSTLVAWITAKRK